MGQGGGLVSISPHILVRQDHHLHRLQSPPGCVKDIFRIPKRCMIPPTTTRIPGRAAGPDQPWTTYPSEMSDNRGRCQQHWNILYPLVVHGPYIRRDQHGSRAGFFFRLSFPMI